MEILSLTRKELEYLIDLCSSELDKSEIDASKVRNIIFQDFDYRRKHIDKRDIPPGFAFRGLFNEIINLLSDDDINKIIKKIDPFTLSNVLFEQKNLVLSSYNYSHSLFMKCKFISCEIQIDLENVHSNLFYDAKMTINDGCRVLQNGSISIHGENNKIILPKSIEYLGKQRFTDQPARSTSNIIVYQGTKKEFSKIQKVGRIDFTVQCSDGVVKYS